MKINSYFSLITLFVFNSAFSVDQEYITSGISIYKVNPRNSCDYCEVTGYRNKTIATTRGNTLTIPDGIEEITCYGCYMKSRGTLAVCGTVIGYCEISKWITPKVGLWGTDRPSIKCCTQQGHECQLGYSVTRSPNKGTCQK